MPLTALIADELVDSTFCEPEVWKTFYRQRPRVEILCRGCSHQMHAKVSSQGLPFFAHDRDEDCASTGESLEHLTLKRLFAESIRECGWTASLEATPSVGDVGGWRADVLAIEPDGSRRIAFEVQLSAMGIGDGRMRTDRYKRDRIETLWICSHHAPWLGHLLGVRVRTVGTKPPFEYSIDRGVMHFKEGKWSHIEEQIGRVVRGLFTGALVEHSVIDVRRGDHGRVLVPQADIEPSKIPELSEAFLNKVSDDAQLQAAGVWVSKSSRIMDEIRAQWKMFDVEAAKHPVGHQPSDLVATVEGPKTN